MISKKRKAIKKDEEDEETNEQLKKRLKASELELERNELERKVYELERKAYEFELERKASEQSVCRYKFIHDINDDKTIISRISLMTAIDNANFEANNVDLKKKIPKTDEFVDDDRSSTTKTGLIRMSGFKRSQVVGTKDEMNLKSVKLPMYKIAKEYLSKRGLDIKKILNEEIEIITKIQTALIWLENNTRMTREVTVQKLFTLYCSGLLEKISVGYSIYAANSILLETGIETIKHNKRCNSRLSGKTDIVIGKTLKSKFDKVDKNKILEKTSIVGEIKPCFGSLYQCKSKIGNSTNQLLAEMLAVSKMRKSKKDIMFTKGILLDCFMSRIAFHYNDANGKAVYAISSLFDTPRNFVLSILVLISDITVADIHKMEGNIINEKDEEDSANFDENDCNEDGSFSKENLFITKTKGDEKRNKTKSNNKNNGTKRQPLKSKNNNVIMMGEDPLVEERRADLQNLAEWEACRLGLTYLNSSNLKLLDRGTYQTL